MSNPFPLPDDIIIESPPRKRRRWRLWLIGVFVAILILASRSLAIYLNALWFGSLGYSDVYWYIFKLKLGLFLVFAVATTAILRSAFKLLEWVFATDVLEPRTIIVNKLPVQIAPARVVRPVAWAVAVVVGLFYGLAMKDQWQTFLRYFNRADAPLADPIFGKPLGFYLFSLPFYDALSGWLVTLAFFVLAASLLFAFLVLPRKILKSGGRSATGSAFTVVSLALAVFLSLFAWRIYLSRYEYLWQDHAVFSGVTFTEANYLLPALTFVSIALLAAALLAIINAFTSKGLRLLLIGVALPVLVYIVGVAIVPAYVQSFVVKPNELGRETPYIEHNIQWTRRAFGLDQIESREFDPVPTVEALDLGNNRPTLDNIRLWDWRALQDTLKQVQAIRTYYDFPDVDVDRYIVNGQMRQTMTAAREMNVRALPEQSRNWVNERLIYTHGYGITMNTANGFTPEGLPQFILSNMPIESRVGDVKVVRPEIYFGQLTSTNVYVKTRLQEFDYPQGEAVSYTSYQGTGGIRIGSGLRRLLLAWALNDLSKLPFSDDVTADSYVLINREIGKMVNNVAPFLSYDRDPFIIVSNDGRLYWMIDAFTESAHYPYSRHHSAENRRINYIRNSVKVIIDAYNGTLSFYVFDSNDPIIQTYRAAFPSLFKDASAMPADLRSHVRYPETMIQVQGEVYGLYHTQNPKVFFQREDVWSVAQHVAMDDQRKRQSEPLDPYFVLMQLPGESTNNEFVIILPFTPANRNNMIGWMAGRCDGENYGKLLVYHFPESRLIEGPVQIEARIDQNPQLSAQFSLWNQQGSRVLRGHLLVIPVGESLLYVEPIYLQAERSPMPELRLVVLAIQERLGFGPNFGEAMTNLFGAAAPGAAPSGVAATTPTPGEAKPDAGQAKPSPTPAQAATVIELINRAIREFEDYQRLTAEGKLAEAGQKLEQHKRTLEELKRVGGR